MTLAELGLVWCQDEAHVAKAGWGEAQSLVHQQLGEECVTVCDSV